MSLFKVESGDNMKDVPIVANETILTKEGIINFVNKEMSMDSLKAVFHWKLNWEFLSKLGKIKSVNLDIPSMVSDIIDSWCLANLEVVYDCAEYLTINLYLENVRSCELNFYLVKNDGCELSIGSMIGNVCKPEETFTLETGPILSNVSELIHGGALNFKCDVVLLRLSASDVLKPFALKENGDPPEMIGGSGLDLLAANQNVKGEIIPRHYKHIEQSTHPNLVWRLTSVSDWILEYPEDSPNVLQIVIDENRLVTSPRFTVTRRCEKYDFALNLRKVQDNGSEFLVAEIKVLKAVPYSTQIRLLYADKENEIANSPIENRLPRQKICAKMLGLRGKEALGGKKKEAIRLEKVNANELIPVMKLSLPLSPEVKEFLPMDGTITLRIRIGMNPQTEIQTRLATPTSSLLHKVHNRTGFQQRMTRFLQTSTITSRDPRDPVYYISENTATINTTSIKDWEPSKIELQTDSDMKYACAVIQKLSEKVRNYKINFGKDDPIEINMLHGQVDAIMKKFKVTDHISKTNDKRKRSASPDTSCYDYSNRRISEKKDYDRR